MLYNILSSDRSADIVCEWICRCRKSFQQMKKEYAALRKKLETYFQVMRIDSEVRYLYVKLVVDVGSVVKLNSPFSWCSWLGKLGPWREHVAPNKRASLCMWWGQMKWDVIGEFCNWKKKIHIHHWNWKGNIACLRTLSFGISRFLFSVFIKCCRNLALELL